MRILHLFNQVNDAYAVAKAMRRRGIDASLLIAYPAPVFSLPQWEDGLVDERRIGDLLRPEWASLNSNWQMPPWIHVWYNPLSPMPWTFLGSRWALRKLIRRYDVLVAHAPGAIYAAFSGRPYIVYDAGWVRYLPRDQSIRGRLALHGYRAAKYIFFTNPDTRGIFDQFGFEPVFVPFAIDTEKYVPLPLELSAPRTADFLILAPSRQDWNEKGNHLAIRAFAQFLQTEPNSVLVLTRWGRDVSRSEALIHELKIEHKVRWTLPLCKHKLIQLYDQADFILDQFVLGSWGTATPEAMACGKPVIMYFLEGAVRDCFGELPPILNARDVEEIVHHMEFLRTGAARARIGSASREWVRQHHDPQLVVDLHMRYLEAITR